MRSRTSESTHTSLVGADEHDARVRAVTAAFTASLGATAPSGPVADDHGTSGTVRCLPVGPHVAEDVSPVLAHADSPVLVVGPHCSDEVFVDGPIVVPFDGSACAASIFPTARAWAHRLVVPIVLTHMWTPLDAVDRGSEIFHAVRDALAAVGPSASFEPIRTSYPAGAIRELAHELDASLVAMSSLGADARPGDVIGHVAARVVRECPCPVLLQRPIVDCVD